MSIIQLLIVIGVIIAGFIGTLMFMNRKLSFKKEDPESVRVMTEWMRQMQASMENRLDKNSSDLNQRLDNAARIMGDLKQELGGVTEVGRSMRDLLAAPKTRGNFGELILEELLKQYLPNANYTMQYRFKNGETVDAVIKLDGSVLCIDSKFPLENFRAIVAALDEAGRESAEKSFGRDVKKHIDDIAKKYILPQEKTYDFALMYVPAEAVYYEIMRNDALMSYAQGKRVFLVSPQAMYHYIHVVAQALRGRRVDEMAQQVLGSFAAIKQEALKFGRDLDVLSRHITNAKGSIDSVNSSFAKLSDKVERASELQSLHEAAEKPSAVLEEIIDR